MISTGTSLNLSVVMVVEKRGEASDDSVQTEDATGSIHRLWSAQNNTDCICILLWLEYCSRVFRMGADGCVRYVTPQQRGSPISSTKTFQTRRPTPGSSSFSYAPFSVDIISNCSLSAKTCLLDVICSICKSEALWHQWILSGNNWTVILVHQQEG